MNVVFIHEIRTKIAVFVLNVTAGSDKQQHQKQGKCLQGTTHHSQFKGRLPAAHLQNKRQQGAERKAYSYFIDCKASAIFSI
ncbi:MAG: hypothetical protein ACFNYJ_09535, partial [Segatella oris]